MATPSQIIDTRDIKGLPVSDAVHAVRDTASGLTDELKNTQLMQILGASAPAYLDDSDWDYEPGVPTLDVVLSKLGVKVNDDPTGIKSARKFVEDFPKKRDSWKKKIERDPNYGKQGWETVYNLFKQTSNDLMNADIAQARNDIATGKDEEGLDWLMTKLTGLAAPRAIRAVKEGRDPTGSEVARDILSNAAYAIPVGGVSSGVGRVLANFAAPTAVSAMDNLVADDGGGFVEDAVAGGMINLGVNRVLGPMLGQYLGSLSGKVSSKLPQGVRAFLEGTLPPRTLARNTLKGAEDAVLKANSPLNALSLRSGVNPISGSAEKSAKDILDLASAAGKTVKGVDGASLNAQDVYRKVLDETAGKLTAKDENAALGAVIQTINNPKVKPNTKDFAEGVNRYASILESNPELKTLFAPKESFTRPWAGIPMTKKQRVVDVVNRSVAPISTYATNQYGSGNASQVLSRIPNAREMFKDDEKEKKKSASASAIRKVLETTPELTDEDEFYLAKVRDNPDLLTFSDDAGLKQWLLKKGHSLLKGTPAHRPLWEVK